MLTKTLVITIFALFLGIFREFIIFLIFYSILRAVGYGAHASSNLSCWIFSILLLIGLPYLVSIIKLNKISKIIIWIISFIAFMLFCPADTEKRPMINKLRKLKFKIIILIIDLIYLVLIFKYESISNYIIAALLLQTFLSSPIGYLSMGQKVRFSFNDIRLTKQ